MRLSFAIYGTPKGLQSKETGFLKQNHFDNVFVREYLNKSSNSKEIYILQRYKTGGSEYLEYIVSFYKAATNFEGRDGFLGATIGFHNALPQADSVITELTGMTEKITSWVDPSYKFQTASVDWSKISFSKVETEKLATEAKKYARISLPSNRGCLVIHTSNTGQNFKKIIDLCNTSTFLKKYGSVYIVDCTFLRNQLKSSSKEKIGELVNFKGTADFMDEKEVNRLTELLSSQKNEQKRKYDRKKRNLESQHAEVIEARDTQIENLKKEADRLSKEVEKFRREKPNNSNGKFTVPPKKGNRFNKKSKNKNDDDAYLKINGVINNALNKYPHLQQDDGVLLNSGTDIAKSIDNLDKLINRMANNPKGSQGASSGNSKRTSSPRGTSRNLGQDGASDSSAKTSHGEGEGSESKAHNFWRGFLLAACIAMAVGIFAALSSNGSPAEEPKVEVKTTTKTITKTETINTDWSEVSLKKLFEIDSFYAEEDNWDEVLVMLEDQKINLPSGSKRAKYKQNLRELEQAIAKYKESVEYLANSDFEWVLFAQPEDLSD